MPDPITREYAPPQDTDKLLDQGLFTLRLPDDWRLKDTQNGQYIFQATKKNYDNRELRVFVDAPPLTKGYNRLLPVAIDSNTIIIVSSVSDNCTAFTGSQGPNKPATNGEATMPAKWQGISFLCDMANYSRNVVGVGTVNSGHALKLTGQTKGAHTFYIEYTDHNINPDYQILERALESLTVK